MLKLEQSQDNLVNNSQPQKSEQAPKEEKKQEVATQASASGPLTDYITMSQSQPMNSQVTGMQTMAFGYPQGPSGDYFEGGAGSLEGNDFLGQDYYYYSGGPVGHGVGMDAAFYNWQLGPGSMMMSGQPGGEYNAAGQYSMGMQAMSGHAPQPGPFDMMPGVAAAGGLISEYEYGLYAAAAAAAVGNNHMMNAHQNNGYHVDSMELAVPVKMPDAMLYPALDEPAASAMTAEAALLNAEQQAGIFNDYFNLGANHSGQANASHPYYYAGGDESGVISHVKPSDVISPELFQSMHLPLASLYGNYQPSMHLMDKNMLGGMQGPSSMKKSNCQSVNGINSKNKKKKPAAPVYGPSFFVPSTKDGSVDPLSGDPGNVVPTTATNGVPSVIGEDGKVYTKPPYSYAALISRALRECDGAKLTLSGIYDWIKSNFPYYRTAEAAWQVSSNWFPTF